MGRKQQLLKEIDQIKGYRLGSNAYRVNIRSKIRKTIEDMAKLNIMPSSLKMIDNNVINRLVIYWKQDKKLKDKTIANYISALKKIPFINISSSSEFGISSKSQTIKKYYLDEDILNKKMSERLRLVLTIQKILPIHPREAEQFPNFLIDENRLTIPRTIAFNNKSRQIEIADKNRGLIDSITKYLSTNSNFTNFIEKKDIHILFSSELSIIKKRKIKNYSFQHLYIKNRLNELGDTKKSIRTIKEELGFSRTSQVEEVLNGS